MNNESLEKTKKRIIEVLSTMDMPLQDRVELMINLLHFLNNYEEHIKVLRLNDKR